MSAHSETQNRLASFRGFRNLAIVESCVQTSPHLTSLLLLSSLAYVSTCTRIATRPKSSLEVFFNPEHTCGCRDGCSRITKPRIGLVASSVHYEETNLAPPLPTLHLRLGVCPLNAGFNAHGVRKSRMGIVSLTYLSNSVGWSVCLSVCQSDSFGQSPSGRSRT